MIRILQVMPNGIKCSGISNFIMEIYRRIDRERVQFDFVIPFVGENEIEEDVIQLGGVIYRCPRYRKNGILSVSNHNDYKRWWIKFLESHLEYKIAHIYGTNTAFAYISKLKHNGIVSIAHLMGKSEGIWKWYERIGQKFVNRMIFDKVDYLFSCSLSLGKEIYGNKILQCDKFHVIPDSIDTFRFKYDSQKRYEMRNHLSVGNDFVLGHVGRLSEVKNQNHLINVFNVLHKTYSRSKLLIIGDGELREQLEKKVQNLHLSDAVTFLGNVSNPQDYYQAMDVFVLPSFSEGLPLVMIEAQASGLPCVVSTGVSKEADMKAVPILWKSLSDDVESWKDAILSYKERPRVDGSEAVRRAGFDISDTAKWLSDFYFGIASGKRMRFIEEENTI